MSDDVRADARRLLEKHADKADLSLDAPTSLDDIRRRLARCTHGCRCDDGDHENAVHDLASSDVPVLLAAFEDALAELDRALATLQQVREWADDLDARADAIAEANPDHVIHIEQARQHAAMIRYILDGGAS